MKKITALFLLFGILLSATVAFADSGFAANDFIFDSEQGVVTFEFEDGVLTFSGEGNMPEPDYFEDPEWFCYAEQTETIIIEEGVTSVGASAFCDFKLVKNVEISDTVTIIGINAFANCESLEEIYIPKSVERFVQSPFVNCYNLKNIVVDSQNPYFCSEDGVLFSKDKTVLWSYNIGADRSSYTIPQEVEKIEAYAFSHADNLSEVNFNSNLKSIGDEAFFASVILDNIELPEGLVFLGGGAFQDCPSLKNISLPSTIEIIRPLAFHNTEFYNDLDNWELGYLYIGEYLLTSEYCVTDPEDWRVEEHYYVSGKITVKEGTRLIAGSAFSWFNWSPEITEIEFPQSLLYINEYALSYCEDITKIRLPENLLHIDEGVFYGCEGINEITIPDSLVKIGEYAFSECSNLSYVNLGSGIKSIGNCAFEETDYFTNTYNYENGYLYNGKYLLGSLKDSVSSPIEIKIGTEVIADNALNGLSGWNAVSVSLPDSLKYIGKEAFLGTNMGEITIPDTVLNIGDYAIGFSGKEYDDALSEYVYYKISDVSIVGNASSAAGKYAKKFGVPFYDYTNYEYGDYTYRISEWGCIITDFNSEYEGELVIPATIGGFEVTGIDRSAFEDCSKITKITIPDAVTYIGNLAFSGCPDIVFVVNCGSYAIKYASDNFIIIDSADCVWSDATCENPKKCQVCNANNGFGLGHDMVFGDEYDYCQREGCNHIVNHVDLRPIQDDFKYSVTEGRARVEKYIGTSENVFIPRECGIYTAVEIFRFTFEECSFIKTITLHNSVNYIDNWAFYGLTGLTDIYFTGTQAEWEEIYISQTGNENLFGANIHYEMSYIDTICTEHSYDNDCDATCNNCDYIRDVEPHKYSNDCDEVCNTCGEKTRTTSHDYKDATCTEPAKCKKCGETEGKALGHNYFYVDPDYAKPTCTESATNIKKCLNCGGTKLETLPSLGGHKFSSSSCLAVCSVCDETRRDYHNFKTTITKATTTKDGKITDACSYCGVSHSKTIYKASSIKFKASSTTYNGMTKRPTVVVKDSKGKTISSSNYSVSYPSGMKNAGTYKIKVTLKGDYSGSKTLTYTIKPASTSKFKASLSKTSYTYDGKSKKPSVTVKTSSGKKLSSSNYTVSYASGRKSVGKYKVTIKFKGNYSGTETLYFTINPAKTSLKKVTGASKSLKVSINKKTTQVTGYEIQYSTSKKFSKPKTATIKSAKTTSTTIKSLKAKTTYYVRVRTYKTVNGKKYYSGWSSYKSAKTK